MAQAGLAALGIRVINLIHEGCSNIGIWPQDELLASMTICLLDSDVCCLDLNYFWSGLDDTVIIIVISNIIIIIIIIIIITTTTTTYQNIYSAMCQGDKLIHYRGTNKHL